MSSPVKLPLLGRATRVRTFQEAQEQVDFIRAKIDSIILGLGNLDDNISSDTGGSGGITAVNSIAANGGTARTGALTFTDTSSITMSQVGQDFKWNIATLPSGVFATPTMTYGTTYAAGVASTVVRSDSRLKFPSALMDTTGVQTLTLTNDGTFGSLLTANQDTMSIAVNSAVLQLQNNGTVGVSINPVGVWSQNTTSIYAPTGAQPFMIGPNGTVATGGSNPSLNTQFLFSASLSSASLQTGYSLGVTNTGTGGVLGGSITVNNNSAAASAVAITGVDTTVQAGGAGATGIIAGYKFTPGTAGAATRTQINAFQNVAAAITGTITGYSGLLFGSPTGGTVTNLTGCNISALSTGTNRRGLWVQAIATGTPTIAAGVDIASISVGTDRWGVRTANKIENTATDFICGTTAKGMVNKDSQGTPRFWREYWDSTGTVGGTFTTDANGVLVVARGGSPTGNVVLNLVDVGTTSPTA